MSPTSTYSRRRIPSSSVSPGMMDPSVDRALGGRGRSVGRGLSDGTRGRVGGISRDNVRLGDGG